MNAMNLRRAMLAAALCILPFAPAALAGGGAHSDFEIGRDDASPIAQLHVEGDDDILNCIEKISLVPGEGELAGYYVAQLPGWESVGPGDPDLLAPLSGHRIALQRISFDAGFTMFDPFGLEEILAADGATYEFPRDLDESFHVDLFFAAPIAAAPGTMYSATYQLVDLAGLHADSAPFTLCFEVVPEPATVWILAGGMLMSVRRRRRT